MQYVESMTDVLSDHLGWHRARLKFMARFTTALLKPWAANLRELAVALKAGVEEESLAEISAHRRIRRFLSNYEIDFTMLGRLLVRLLPQTPPYRVVLDRTEWHFGQTPVNILMVGIAHKGMAFPVSWTVLPDTVLPDTVLPDGGSSSAEQHCAEQHCRALQHFFAVVDPSDVSVVLGDREFISAAWLRWLQRRDVPFAVRLRSDRRIGLAPGGSSLPARMFARFLRVGDERVLGGMRYLHGAGGEHVETEHVETKVVVRRIAPASEETDDAFLILATWDIDPEKATMLYQERWEIETMFAALKSRGYRLEKTHLTALKQNFLQQVERLVGLLALAFAWTHVVGERRAAREGPPRLKPHGRRQRSLFRYGLDLLRGILTTPRPQPAAFFDCLRGLRSPTAFLSCT